MIICYYNNNNNYLDEWRKMKYLFIYWIYLFIYWLNFAKNLSIKRRIIAKNDNLINLTIHYNSANSQLLTKLDK